MADKVEKRILTLYSDVQATSVHWLWYGYVSMGILTGKIAPEAGKD